MKSAKHRIRYDGTLNSQDHGLVVISENSVGSIDDQGSMTFTEHSMGNVESLNLSAFSKFLDNKKLRILTLTVPEIRSINLSLLRECIDLTDISLCGCFNLEDVDLSPLTRCKSLKSITISGTNIKSLDLTPIKHFPDLDELFITNNRSLATIDLEPLHHHKSVRALFLDFNRIKEINLIHLDGSNIEELSLSHNPLKELDFTGEYPFLNYLNLSRTGISNLNLRPLYISKYNRYPDWPDEFNRPPFNQKEDLEIDLTGTKIDEIDVSFSVNSRVFFYIDDLQKRTMTAFYFLKSVIWINDWEGKNPFLLFQTVDDSIERIGWESTLGRLIDVFTLMSPKRQRYEASIPFLQEMGISELAGLRYDIPDMLSKLVGHDFETSRTKFLEMVVDDARRRIDAGESTMDMDLDAISASLYAKLGENIANARKREVMTVEVRGNIRTGTFVVDKLYRTVYGRRILESITSGPPSSFEITFETYRKIKDILAEMDIHVEW